MILGPLLSRRLPFRILQRLVPVAQTRIGGLVVNVPTYEPAALGWIYWQPSWKNVLLAHFLEQRRGSFVDIGVNTGQTLADFLSIGSAQSYIGLEPNPHCLAFVDRIVALNQLKTVSLLPVGAAATRGLQSFFVTENSVTDQTATLRAGLRPLTDRRMTWVNTLTLDEALESLVSASVALLKIDVEGAELEALTGASNLLSRIRPPILCEVLLADAQEDFAGYRMRLEALTHLLQAHGYRIYQLAKDSDGRLPALRPLSSFPLGVWTPGQADECDYLFAPADCDLAGFNMLSANLSH